MLSAVGAVQVLQLGRLGRLANPVIRVRQVHLETSQARGRSLARRTSGVLAVYATRGSDSAKLREIDQNEQVMRCHTRGRDSRRQRMGST